MNSETNGLIIKFFCNIKGEIKVPQIAEDEEGGGDVGGKLRLDVSHSEIVRGRRVFKDGTNSKGSGYGQLGTQRHGAKMFFRADAHKGGALEGMIGSNEPQITDESRKLWIRSFTEYKQECLGRGRVTLNPRGS